MNHTFTCRIAETPKSPALRHIVESLLQAEEDQPLEVVFAATCAKPDGQFRWRAASGLCTLEMPQSLHGSQVRETLMQITGLDDSRPFPKVSKFILGLEGEPEIGTDQPPVLRMRWQVSLESIGAPIRLEMLPVSCPGEAEGMGGAEE